VFIITENKKYLAISILIGGESIRFGMEKAAIELFDKPLLLHQIETLSKFDEDIYLIAHSEQQIIKYKAKINFPRKVNFLIDDKEFFSESEGFKSLIGIYTAFNELNKLGFQKVFLLSCDMPLIKSEVIRLLINEVKGHDCCIPKWKNGYLEPFFAIYPVKKALSKVINMIKNDTHALVKILDPNWKINYLSVEEKIKPLDNNLLSLMNINGPIDVERAVHLYEEL
jgi:molybdopterin-guanine dinucleotide biosynthesis protein A